jgi:hypothetical protein
MVTRDVRQRTLSAIVHSRRAATTLARLTLGLACILTTPASAQTPDVAASLPSNLLVPTFYRSILDTMWRRSPTFRRQCVRIGSEPNLTVVVQAGPVAVGTRATTRIETKRDGRRLASVNVGEFGDPVELIAHEIEHIVEQLDGADLAALAARSVAGVRRSSDEMFETVRAVRAGERVAEEVRGRRH